MVAAILEGGRVTIDVAPLNAEELAILRPIIEGATGKFAWSAIEMRQMLATIDAAYEERDRLRVMLERLRNRMAEPDQPIIQWDAGTWIPRIDAALEGRE